MDYKRVHSFFKSDNGVQILHLRGTNAQQHRKTDLLLSNTLQPISSDNDGRSDVNMD